MSLSLLVSFNAILFGQELNYLPAGLHKLSKKELKERPISLRGIPFYLDGELVAEKQLAELVADPTYALDYYGDRNAKIKAVVIRLADEKELKAKKELIPAPRNPVDWKGREAPDFERTALNGNEISLAELKGSVVVLSFWNVKCGSCVDEMPALNELVASYQDKEVVFLAPTGDIEPDIRDFLKKQGFDFTIIPDARSLIRRYGVMLFPMYFIIDQQGTVQFCQYQAHPETYQNLADQINLLIDK
jgi:peroxiredoxin